MSVEVKKEEWIADSNGRKTLIALVIGGSCLTLSSIP